MRFLQQPDKAEQTHASEQHDGGHSKETDTLQSINSLPFGNKSPAWGVRGQNMPQRIKTIVVQYSNSYT